MNDAFDIVHAYVTGEPTGDLRRELSREAVEKVAAAGWRLKYYRGFRGYKFYCQREGASFATSRDMVFERAFLEALRVCLALDAELKTLPASS